MIDTLQYAIHSLHMPVLLVVGLVTAMAFYVGRSMKYIRLPSIIGFMIIGVLLGPSLLDVLSEELQSDLGFIPEIALGFVAVSIGLELSLTTLRRQGWSMILIILAESFMAFLVVTGGIYLLTGDLPIALLFGAIAPASAPAGTVAVIQEYRARGSLTNALYSVVGFDDGLGIIIFGFAAAFARSILLSRGGMGDTSIWITLTEPLVEVGLSVVVGIVMAYIFSLLARRLTSGRDLFILTFATVLATVGISTWLGLSLILTNMILGMVTVNTQPVNLIEKIRRELTDAMPLLFVLFFTLAGANLHIDALPALGLLGVVYIFCRSAGLMGGAWLGSTIGRAEEKIRKYLGMGILSQAGVAIGLALIVKQEFTPLGEDGALIGTMVITTVTATSIFFELVGPILTKIGLEKAGEISAR